MSETQGGVDAAIPQRTPVTSQATMVEQARAVAEAQAAVVVAQQCPRDMSRALGEMKDACGRLALAERAFYSVSNRGKGSTVHLMRELARIWGNIQYGVVELRRDDAAGESEIQAFAWDLQTNSRSVRSFIVPHQRMKGGKRVDLVDLGDVYLNNQNIGARAVRECIRTILPDWYVAEAEQVAQNALRHGDGTPLADRITVMVTKFSEIGVRQSDLEARTGRKRGQWDAGDVSDLRIVFESIQRRETTVAEEFPRRAVTADQLPAANAPKAAGAATGGIPTEDPPANFGDEVER